MNRPILTGEVQYIIAHVTAQISKQGISGLPARVKETWQRLPVSFRFIRPRSPVGNMNCLKTLKTTLARVRRKRSTMRSKWQSFTDRSTSSKSDFFVHLPGLKHSDLELMRRIDELYLEHPWVLWPITLPPQKTGSTGSGSAPDVDYGN